DNTGATAIQTVTVTITGTNENPVITAHTDGSVTKDVNVVAGNLTSSGAVLFTDVDLTDTHTVHATFLSSTNAAGVQLGTLTAGPAVNSDTTGSGTGGSVSWNFAVSNNAVTFLAAEQSITETYVVEVDDNHGGKTTQNVLVTISGTNGNPVITAHTDGSVTKDVNVVAGNLTSSGAVLFTDV